MFASKQDLRNQIKNRRKKLSDKYISVNSKIIFTKLINFIDNKKNNIDTRIISYWKLFGEPDLTQFNEWLIKNGYTLFLPKMQETEEFKIYKLDELSHLKQNKYKIYEPIQNVEFEFNQIQDNTTIILCPGLAFDKSGKRIGFGMGCYDKFFFKHPEKKFYKIGITFNFGLFEHIPFFEKTDVFMDCIFTQNKTCIINKLV